MGKFSGKRGRKSGAVAAKSAARVVRRSGVNLVGSASEAHPVVVEALAQGARLNTGQFEVAHVPNPHGEVVQRGAVRRHVAVRRVPVFETLQRTGAIDEVTAGALRWYADRLALAESGLVKCGLAVGGGGGSADSHIPINMAAMMARSDVAWAKAQVPRLAELRALDGVMVHEMSFAALAPVLYPFLSVERARRRVAAEFKKGAGRLVEALGARRGTHDRRAKMGRAA